jgi:putative membrane protein
MRLVGIMDADQFRNEILQRREALKQRGHSGAMPDAAAGDAQLAVLKAMQLRLDEIAALLRERR